MQAAQTEVERMAHGYNLNFREMQTNIQTVSDRLVHDRRGSCKPPDPRYDGLSTVTAYAVWDYAGYTSSRTRLSCNYKDS